MLDAAQEAMSAPQSDIYPDIGKSWNCQGRWELEGGARVEGARDGGVGRHVRGASPTSINLRVPLGPLGFEGAQHRQTLRSSRRRDPQQSPASFRIAVKDLVQNRVDVHNCIRAKEQNNGEGQAHVPPRSKPLATALTPLP